MATLLYFIVCPEEKTDPEQFARFCYERMKQKQVRRLVSSSDSESLHYLQSFSKLLHCEGVVDFNLDKRHSSERPSPLVRVPKGVRCISADFGKEDETAFRDRVFLALEQDREGPKVLLLARETVDEFTDRFYPEAVLLESTMSEDDLTVTNHVNQTVYQKFQNAVPASSLSPPTKLVPPILGREESNEAAPVLSSKNLVSRQAGMAQNLTFEVTKEPVKSPHLGISSIQSVFVTPTATAHHDLDLPISAVHPTDSGPSDMSPLSVSPPLSQRLESTRDVLSLAASQNKAIDLSQICSQVTQLITASFQEVKVNSQSQDLETALSIVRENVLEAVNSFVNRVQQQYETQIETERKIAADAIEECSSAFRMKMRNFESVFQGFGEQQREMALLISELKSALDRSIERHVTARVEAAIKEIERLKQTYDKLYEELPSIKQKQHPLEIISVVCQDTEICFEIRNRKLYSLEDLTLQLKLLDGEVISDIPKVSIHPGTQQLSVPLTASLSGSVLVSLLQFYHPVCDPLSLSFQQLDVSSQMGEKEVDVSSQMDEKEVDRQIDEKFARVKEMLGGDSISQEVESKLAELRNDARAEIWPEELIANKAMPVG